MSVGSWGQWGERKTAARLFEHLRSAPLPLRVFPMEGSSSMRAQLSSSHEQVLLTTTATSDQTLAQPIEQDVCEQHRLEMMISKSFFLPEAEPKEYTSEKQKS